MLGTRNEIAKESSMKGHNKEKIKVKKCIYQSNKEMNDEQFVRKMNQDGNRKLFSKEERWRVKVG